MKTDTSSGSGLTVTSTGVQRLIIPSQMRDASVKIFIVGEASEDQALIFDSEEQMAVQLGARLPKMVR